MTLAMGSVPASSTLYVPFATYDANGASITMTGFALSDILIYKNGSTTQRSSTSGFTLLDTDGTDFDGLTGIHGFSIDLSDNTDAGFYAAGATYWIVISSVTVNSQTVSFVAATFRIVAAENTSGTPVADTVRVGGTTQTARDLGASVLLSSGTGTGQLDFTSGVVKANLAQILGTALTETAGQIAAAFKQFFNIASPTSTMNTITTVTTATNLTNAPTAGDFTATMKTSLNAATPASVVGAVGSVTGNVGGNVTGSVGSVVGAVGSVTGNVGGNVTGSVGSLAAQAKADVFVAAIQTQLTEGYAADGAAPTMEQFAFATQQFQQEKSVSSTTMTVKKLDGSTTAMTFTLDSATAPTSITRAT